MSKSEESESKSSILTDVKADCEVTKVKKKQKIMQST